MIDSDVETGWDPITFNADGWNRYRIRVLGSHRRIWINGRRYLDEETEEATSGKVAIEGPARNFWIRSLD